MFLIPFVWVIKAAKSSCNIRFRTAGEDYNLSCFNLFILETCAKASCPDYCENSWVWKKQFIILCFLCWELCHWIQCTQDLSILAILEQFDSRWTGGSRNRWLTYIFTVLQCPPTMWYGCHIGLFKLEHQQSFALRCCNFN